MLKRTNIKKKGSHELTEQNTDMVDKNKNAIDKKKKDYNSGKQGKVYQICLQQILRFPKIITTHSYSFLWIEISLW